MDIERAVSLLDELRSFLFLSVGCPILIQGTILGAYREGKIIPDDYDIDLAFIELRKESIEKLKEVFSSLSFQLTEEYNDTFFSFKKDNNIVIDIHNGRFIDEFFVIDVPIVTDYYPRELFENLTTIDLYGKSYLSPQPIEEYLRLTYGENWRIPKTFTDHDNLFKRVWKNE